MHVFCGSHWHCATLALQLNPHFTELHFRLRQMPDMHSGPVAHGSPFFFSMPLEELATLED